jgi:hypothetical protein
VAPWDGRYLGEQTVLDVDALLSDEADSPAQIDSVPQDDGVDDEVEPAGAVRGVVGIEGGVVSGI